jgi:hypothetical protein
VPFYEKALGLSQNHFAAQHYLTHAHENARRAADALPYAASYAKAAPVVPHALHMHGHVLRQLGRVDEAVAAFESAQKVQMAYLQAEKIPPELDWHYEHNVDLLAASYRYLGRMREAEGLLEQSFGVPSSLAVQMFNKREWPELLIARGRTKDAIAAAGVLASHPSPLISAVGYIMTGRAYLAAGQYKDAAGAANAALKALRAATAGQALVAPELEVLQGEFFLRTGQPEKGRAMLDEIVRGCATVPAPIPGRRPCSRSKQSAARRARPATGSSRALLPGSWPRRTPATGVHTTPSASSRSIMARPAPHRPSSRWPRKPGRRPTRICRNCGTSGAVRNEVGRTS